MNSEPNDEYEIIYREIYYETFYAYLEMVYCFVNRETVRPALDIFFDYTTERGLDMRNLSLKETEEFLSWYRGKAETWKQYDYLLGVLMDFSEFMVLLDHSGFNYFKWLCDRKAKRLMSLVRMRRIKSMLLYAAKENSR